MATSQMSGVIQHLRKILRDGAELTDEQLLEDYISHRDEAALTALVRRHGPMVWGVCRRVLRNHHDAEDAFQATFLVFVRRAASIASRELLTNWLYGVAHQTALKARATTAKRKGRESQVTVMPEKKSAGTQQDQWCDLQPLLDEELSRLPDKYRGIIVLCDLEGKTRKEVAAQLRCPEGTVASRLVRARTMLAKRLTHRGVAFSGGALAVVLAQQAVLAGVPNALVDSTIKAASLLAAGNAAATGAISVKIVALTERVMKAMLFTKLKAAIGVLAILGFVATLSTVLACRTAAGQGEKPPIAEKPVKTPERQEFVGGEIPPPKTEAAKGLRLTLSADKTETWMDSKAPYGAVPVKLKLTFTNAGDKPVKLDAYALPYRIKFQCVGPTPDSVKKKLAYIDQGALPPPTEKDYPLLQPGKSWSPSWTPEFPGDIPDGIGTIAAYYLHKPGNYKLRMTVYDKFAPHVEGAASGTKWLESNELEVTVREKAPAGKVEPAEGAEVEPVKGLKLTLSADKTETWMKPGEDYGALPVKLKLTFTNSSDKPIKLNAYALPFRIKFHCDGPSPDSIHTLLEYVQRGPLAPATDEDSPVLQSGKSWSPKWNPSFPGDIPEGYGKSIAYYVRQPGTYNLRMTVCENMMVGQPERIIWLESNELVLKVREMQ